MVINQATGSDFNRKNAVILFVTSLEVAIKIAIKQINCIFFW
jgi:hypothetical protein